MGFSVGGEEVGEVGGGGPGGFGGGGEADEGYADGCHDSRWDLVRCGLLGGGRVVGEGLMKGVLVSWFQDFSVFGYIQEVHIEDRDTTILSKQIGINKSSSIIQSRIPIHLLPLSYISYSEQYKL